jgi:hypothetical protein
VLNKRLSEDRAFLHQADRLASTSWDKPFSLTQSYSAGAESEDIVKARMASFCLANRSHTAWII